VSLAPRTVNRGTGEAPLCISRIVDLADRLLHVLGRPVRPYQSRGIIEIRCLSEYYIDILVAQHHLLITFGIPQREMCQYALTCEYPVLSGRLCGHPPSKGALLLGHTKTFRVPGPRCCLSLQCQTHCGQQCRRASWGRRIIKGGWELRRCQSFTFTAQ
jgi:hypothetical protein